MDMRFFQIIASTLLIIWASVSVAASEDEDIQALRNIVQNHAYALTHGENDDDAYIYGLRALARKGQRESQFLLGGLALAGMIPIKEGAQWLVRASSQGCAGAAGILGALYMSGKGVKKNTVAGIFWLKAAASKGDPGAQVALSEVYFNGMGSQSINPVLAYSWILQSLEHPAIATRKLIKLELPMIARKHHLTDEQAREAEKIMRKRLRDMGGIKPYFCGSSLPSQGAPIK